MYRNQSNSWIMNDSHGIPYIMNHKDQGIMKDDLVVHQHYDEKVDVYHDK